jgi:hypothetical protein
MPTLKGRPRRCRVWNGPLLQSKMADDSFENHSFQYYVRPKDNIRINHKNKKFKDILVSF